MIPSFLRKLFAGALKRGDAENPAIPLAYPDDDTFSAYGLDRAAGVTVNPETALRISACYRAVNLISRDVAKIPFITYRRRDPKGKDRVPKYPVSHLLRRRPNPIQTAFIHRYCAMTEAQLHGNHYSKIRRESRTGTPLAMIPLDPIATYPQVRARRIFYVTPTAPGGTTSIPADDVFHIRGLGDQLRGKSVIRYARESIGSALAAQTYGSAFFANDARPGIVLEHPKRLTPSAKKNIRETWAAIHGGPKNAGRPAVIEEDMKLHAFSMSNEDAQFLGTKEFTIRDIANWFGVPPHKLGDNSRAAYNSLEQENQSYLDDTLDGWLCQWEAEADAKLFPEADQDEYFAEFLRDAVYRTDLRARSDYYNRAVLTGWMSRDEVRDRENLNPIPDGTGDIFLVPLNSAPLAGDGQGADGQGGDGQGTRAIVDILAAVTLRMARRIAHHAKKAARQGRIAQWIDRDLATHADTIRDAVTPPLRALASISPDATPIDPAEYTDYILQQARNTIPQDPEGISSAGLTSHIDRAIARDLTPAILLHYHLKEPEQ